MALAKIETSIGVTICLGVCKVVTDKNGNVISTTQGNEYGEARLKFRVIGASRKLKRKDGQEYWKTQRCNCSIGKSDPLAEIVKSLNEHDKLWIYGELKKGKYIDGDTGQEKNSLFCNLEDIRIIARADGTTPTAINDCEDTQDDDDNWSDI